MLVATSRFRPVVGLAVSALTLAGLAMAAPTVQAQPVPTVTAISPSTGPFYGGTSVTVTGTAFDTTAGTTSFALGTDPDTGAPDDMVGVSCSSSTTCTGVVPFAFNGPATGAVDVIATVNGTASAANAPADQFTYGSTITGGSSKVAYVYDFGAGINDTAGPGAGSSIFVNAIGNDVQGTWGGKPIGTGDTGTFAGVNFTDVPVSTVDANPTTALSGFDTVVLYEVCDIGTHPNTLSALNNFVDNGGKLIIYDADACYGTFDGINPSGTPDYSGFIFPFTTSNPGPQGASGSYTSVEPSALTAGLAVGPQPFDAVGDANVFTSNTGAWCNSIDGTNVLGTSGFIQAYASTPGGGLVIYNGEDNWFTDQPSNHLAQVFSLSLALPTGATGLPCSIPASGIKLAPTSATASLGTVQTLTATVVDSNGNPTSGVTVTFSVTSGPDKGLTGTGTTAGNGDATFSYTNKTTAGPDTVVAQFTDPSSVVHSSNTSTITWVAPGNTSVSTSLSGGAQSGAKITVPAGTAVTDTATLTGTAATTATGSVTYDVYSDTTCSTAVITGTAETITTPGTLPASSPVTLSTPGAYYWQASYSGDANNLASKSTCGDEVETVTALAAPTELKTRLRGVGYAGGHQSTWSGGTIIVFSRSAVTDSATLRGANAAEASGTVTYTVYGLVHGRRHWFTHWAPVASGGTFPVTAGVVPGSNAVRLRPGDYEWQATYSGDALNKPAKSRFGSETEIVIPAPKCRFGWDGGHGPSCREKFGSHSSRFSGDRRGRAGKR